MKNLRFIIIILLVGCTKPQSVYMCGEYACKNKNEMNKYFEKNLSIEVALKNKSSPTKENLVNFNLKKDISDKKKTNKFFEFSKINKEKRQNKNIKEKKLSKKEEVIKANTNNDKDKNKDKNKDNIFVKLKKFNEPKNKKLQVSESAKKKNINIFSSNKISSSCSNIENCDIDNVSNEISKTSKNKDYPDITSK